MNVKSLNRKSKPFNTSHYQTVALAATFTTIDQIVQLANYGAEAQTNNSQADTKAALIESLFSFSSQSPDSIYPDLTLFKSGYQSLNKLLKLSFEPKEKHHLNYFFGINKLGKLLLAKPALQKALKENLQAIDATESYTSDWMYTQLNRIYQDTISPQPYRINIQGKQSHLSQASIQRQIRSLLLCAIRANVLWRQLGGNNWQLFTRKKHYLHAIEQTLHRLQNQ